MFDFAWSEFALIGVVALIAIGPKDMPVAIKTVAQLVKKARKMAGEFQTHVDEMLRDADLHDVKKQFNEIRSFDFKGTMERAVDSDGAIRKTFEDDPLRTTSFSSEPVATASAPASGATPEPAPVSFGAATQADVSILDRPAATAAAERPDPAEAASRGESVRAPAFIPPSVAAPPRAPAFIPPAATRTPSRRVPA